MALIPAGEFWMGSENGNSDEQPVHKVYLNAFYMDIYETTNALYEKCVQAKVCKPLVSSGQADHPVINVTWDQARTFCEWRNARLPTEAEWEKAARGGLEGKLYPWGGESPDCQRANFRGCVGDTSQAGSYPANGYGLFDMAGNVWEWVADWYGANYYASSPSEKPAGPDSGDSRVVRGGSWYVSANVVRSAVRYAYAPADRSSNLGFRCSRSP
jgi:formylglycine-generating enzyme required for sulfatase activity